MYQELLYEQWKSDPQSVDPAWREYFEALERAPVGPSAEGVVVDGTSATAASATSAPAVGPSAAEPLGAGATASAASSAAPTSSARPPVATSVNFSGKPARATIGRSADKQARVDSLMWTYRDVGAIYAQLNPLGAYETPEMRYMRITVEGAFESLSLDAFGLDECDLDTEFETGGYFDPPRAKLREIIRMAKETYCDTLGSEFLHIKNRVMRRWLLERIESSARRRVWNNEEKIRFQKDLIKAEEFEQFVHTNFIGHKRFSLEGGEGLIPAVHYLIYSAAQHSLTDIVLGMAHRGRLNVFTNALRKPAVETFVKFIDSFMPHVYGGTGDVKYHLGHSFDYVDPRSDKKIHISLVANPSHLEAVDPVVQGKARAIQRRRHDFNRKKVLPVLIHGDAAFSGQGVVAETLNLSQLKGYRTGGTVHIIVNNQIGFTTASRDARSTYFATDFAKGLQIPIFHANGDDPEAVVRAVDLAIRWRQKFGYDVVVDIVCYRRLGHNEADEPSFTHPIMYRLIKDHPSAATIYGRKLDETGVWSAADQTAFRDRYRGVLKEQLSMAQEGYKPNFDDAYQGGDWQRFQRAYSFEPVPTGVDPGLLRAVGDVLTTIPDGFGVHAKLRRMIADRRTMLDTGEKIDWGFAEALAFGSLLREGFPIRLSGEDSARGTFGHRHAEWWDVETAQPRVYAPLAHLAPDQGSFDVYDSPLSEFAVLGFDYGYSLAQPNMLVIWEAQFGDFVNGAQVIIDQFISSSESKWFRSSGLVMLLPHGYEGQGPEHSSAHLERFLQLCADQNWQVVNPTTPAQIFHLLRRQMHQAVRKPLVVMSPKSLLRHKEAQSRLDELTSGHFQVVLDDPQPPATAETVVFCSGKVYYDLLAKRRELGADTTAIIRVEQLYPWPHNALLETFARYRDADRIVWAQEESRNRGAWRFVQNRLADVVGRETIEYAGRAASPSPATGSFKEHEAELNAVLNDAIRARQREIAR